MSSTIATPQIETRSRWHSEPQLREVLTIALTGAALFIVTVLHFRDYHSAVLNFGDSQDYISAANAIRHWNFDGLQVKQFWGYSYAMAAVSAMTRLPMDTSLLVVSFFSCMLSIALAYRLWGGWIAALFAVLNFDWIQRSLLGGAEQLFVVLLFASFWAIRRKHWALASCLASCATITRPLGLFALVAICLALLIRRDNQKALVCTLIGAVLGALYVLPFWIYFGDPLYQVHRYQAADWHSGPTISWPFYAIEQSIVHNQAPWTNLVLTLGWIVLVGIGTVVILREKPQLQHERAAEWLFAVFYLGFLFCYNSPQWARAEFARFAIPILPFVYLALSRWIPQDRRLLWALGVVSPVLAAASSVGIRNVIAALGG